MNDLDRAISAIAKRQGGHVTRGQLKAFGLTDDAIKHRISRGFLIAVFSGVYAVGHVPSDPVAQAKAAYLAVGPGSALAGRSAAALHGIYPRWTRPYELTSPVDRRPSGLIVHHRPTLIPVDIVVRHGLRATSPALTILDIASQRTDRQLIRAIDDLRLDRRLRATHLEDVLTRFPRHPGARQLRQVTGRLQDEPTRSNWEIEWPPYAIQHDLPPYAMNVVVCGYRVDVLFVPDLLIAELDGWQSHQSRHAFEFDRQRDATILDRLGIVTIRITHDRFHKRPAEEAARLRRLVAAERARRRAA